MFGTSADAQTLTAIGDTETSVEWEFLAERRYRPAFTALGVIKWPTASNPDAGEPGFDYSLGLILSKDFVFAKVDFGAVYTIVGDSSRTNNLELSLAGEYPLNRTFSIEAEVVHAWGGGAHGQAGTIGGLGPGGNSDTAGTLAVAWQVDPHLKLEQGITVRADRSWQVVFAWEYNFAGE